MNCLMKSQRKSQLPSRLRNPRSRNLNLVKPVKKKRVISDKQSAQLAENLKRGRETSLKNRRAKKAANAAAKSGKIVAAAPSIDHSTDIKQLRDEVSAIKKERAAEKEQKRLRKLEKEELKKEEKRKRRRRKPPYQNLLPNQI